MIQLGGVELSVEEPLLLALLVGVGVLALILVLLVVMLLRPTRIPAALAHQLHVLGNGQAQLQGNLQTASDTQANAQTQLIQSLEARMATVQLQMQQQLAQMQERTNQSLHGSAQRTTTSLTQLQERLKSIDRAQDNITKLSGDVLSLQDILSNKQTRGAFGEIQLNDIVSKALPSDSYTMQKTLSNGRRADCLIHLPNPPGPIVIDAKFPLEAYEALHRASTDWELKSAVANMRTSIRKHIRDISEKYILDGETADGALMFLPSEAVYAELHANFPELVREGFDARVWIVSPTTCMATLNTMRAILKDARMREQAGEIRKTLRLLHRDVELIVSRVGKLDTHFRQAREDIEGIGTAAERAGKRAARLDNFDFEEVDKQEAIAPLPPLPQN
ncbi:DNA recombination protein RmuC [Sulfitobacter undariae]|uniref:DNA recombination protein RmuC homolog n=1 Tax=Sulfitobacter undariae TaxID=1563671 RepID=A0A7W6E9W5_9RHOB|nr:DNA recombination protein RmuC [Sulfitobacter undariae]MBB3994393.1 DNA recombination protein RmuC [Sulfitobacter undariae]